MLALTKLAPTMTLLLITALALLMCKQVQAIEFGDMGGMNGANKPCRPFSCSKGYAPVPKRRGGATKLTSAGCDAMGGGMIMLTNPGNNKADKPYESCCDQWHACYQICGSNKLSCDDTYKSCVKTKCGADEDCNKSSEMNIMLMQLGGCQKYEQLQNVACECVTKEKDKHVQARQAALEKFYKKYAPDNVHKAPELMKKVDTIAKLAKLFQKLVQKYPESIERVEDPQAETYRKMMEDAAKNKATTKEEDEEVPVEDEESDETEDLDSDNSAKEEL